jgi:hypothetical protein
MTAQSSIPLKWYVPFAQGDSSRAELPVTTSDPTRASQTLGFPPLTMQPPESGGVPPQGEDFNGGLNQVARIAWWVLNGGGWPYDSTFATNSNINGYPNGAKLQSADFKGDWISTSDNNQANPDTNGAGWVPGFQYGTTALTGLTGGTVTPTPAQAAKGSITLAGTLTSALTVILPTWTKNWTITNNTTGAFVTIVKTAAGSGVTIPQNGAPTLVRGDGTNITQVSENIAAATSGTQAMQLGQATGRLINVQIFTSTSTYTPTAGTTSVVVEAVGGGGGGGGANAAGAGQISAGGHGGGGAYAKGRFTSAFSGVTVTIGAGGAAGGTGGTGGTTSFGALLVVTGGAGGGAGVGFTPPGSSGGTSAGGTVSAGGDIESSSGFVAQATVAVTTTTIFNVVGAQSHFGPGPIGGFGNGTAAANFGTGGTGALAGPSTGPFNGATGKNGVVIVWEYS